MFNRCVLMQAMQMDVDQILNLGMREVAFFYDHCCSSLL
ncbi:hypothetical protein PJ15_0153 [Acinetobacter sp. neg1]|nr:hypothetical protein PJ15_0153 [Acinetobacter sp. neg1]